jgi:hypothetical protein
MSSLKTVLEKPVTAQSFPEQSFPEQPDHPITQRPGIDISQLTVEQLKSLAYDQVLILEQTRNNIAILQAEIAKRRS